MTFENNKATIVMENGKPRECSSIKEKVELYVNLLLRTEFGKYKVNDSTDFGLTVYKYISNKDIPISIVKSELKREIKEQLVYINAINIVDNFEINRKGNQLNVSFDIHLKDGESVQISEVVINAA